MKLRQIPEDFIVEEIISPAQISSAVLKQTGSHTLYFLEKKHINTLDAVEIICRIWKKRKPEIGFCGLKDKHAYAKQYLSIRNGPRKNIILHAFSLKYLGETNKQLAIGDLRNNCFQITIRDLDKKEIELINKRCPEIEKSGYPNYFDYQRFGSVRPRGEFIARYLLAKNYEAALKNILAVSSKYETKIKKKIIRTIAAYWGKWKELMDLIPKSSERIIINYLKDHPENFKTAFELIERRLRFLIVTSYQSYLWNEIIKLYLKNNLEQNNLIPVSYEIERFNLKLLFYHSLPEDKIKLWQDLSFPLPVHNLELAEELQGIYREALAEDNLTLEDFKLCGMEKTYFPKDKRKFILIPEDLKILETANDTLNRNRLAVKVSFSLPSGSYATVLIKRLTYDF